MNNKNDTFTPRERVDAEFLEKLLRENDGNDAVVTAACPSCPKSRSVPQKAIAPREECCRAYPSLAMVYSPCQEFTDLYEADEGLRRGTIFMQLDKPLNAGCCREGWRKA